MGVGSILFANPPPLHPEDFYFWEGLDMGEFRGCDDALVAFEEGAEVGLAGFVEFGEDVIKEQEWFLFGFFFNVVDFCDFEGEDGGSAFSTGAGFRESAGV